MKQNLTQIKIKAVLSGVILVLFVLVGFSGVGLLFAPKGYRVRLSNWTFLGFSREALLKMHSLPGLILTFACRALFYEL